MRGPPPYCPSPPIPFPQVGVLVAKTLSNASANPFIASAAGVYNPVLALDVFLVQVRGGGCCWGEGGGACAEEVAVGMYKPVLLTVTVPRLAPPPPSGPPPSGPPPSPLLSPCRPPPTHCSVTSSHSSAPSGCSTSSARGGGCASRCECVCGGARGEGCTSRCVYYVFVFCVSVFVFGWGGGGCL